MIKIPDNGWIATILGIDNGTNTMGAAIGELDLRTGHLHIAFAETCTASRAEGRFDGIGSVRGSLYSRRPVLREFIRWLLEEFNPGFVLSEGPFSHLNIDTYFRLRVTITEAIEEEVWIYSPNLEVEMVPPTTAKKAVKASSYVGKEPMREAILALTEVSYARDVNPLVLDEHCIDAIAVVYYKAVNLLREVHRRR